jgi:uncharacterized protein
MINRRDILGGAAIGGGLAALSQAAMSARASTPAISFTPPAEKIYADIVGFEIDDTHCHAITPLMWREDKAVSVDYFLVRGTLTGMAMEGYLPTGIWGKWVSADAGGQAKLDSQYGVAKVMAVIAQDLRESAYVKFMTKELAAYLGCKPRLEEVVEARNALAANYPKYLNGLFRDINLANVMTDTGYCHGCEGNGLDGYQKAILPTRVRAIARVDTLQQDLLTQDISFDELEENFTKRLRDALDGTGNFGYKSYGMKSYLLPLMGLLRPVYDRSVAAKSWEEYKKNRPTDFAGPDRDEQNMRGKDLKLFLLTIAMEACLERDMPMQFHAGDGEAPSIILRNQHPYDLEEMVRFDKNGVMRMPKVVPIHGGYPLVGELTWLCHLYPNCYYEMSIMNPFVHQGLSDRLREVMEAVPMSKILYGSDTWCAPEQYWLAGRWGKRFMSEALGVYVREGVLSHEEAVAGAKLMLHENNRRLYNFS